LSLDSAPPLIRERLRRMVADGANDLAPLETWSSPALVDIS
jgi:hypothetical protein